MRIRPSIITGILLVALSGALRPVALADSGSAACRSAPPADFVAGTIAQVAAQQITVQVANSCAPPVVIGIAPATQICRRTCAATWRDLRPGDRVETALVPGPTGAPTARWVDANSFAGYGTVTALAPGAVTIVLTRGAPGAAHVLLVGPATVLTQADGTTLTGQVGRLLVGDAVYFTGTMDSPDPRTRDIWALRLFQLGPSAGAAPLPAAGAGGMGGVGRSGPALALLLALGLLLSGRPGRPGRGRAVIARLESARPWRRPRPPSGQPGRAEGKGATTSRAPA